ncbi:MFS general substrate transporter [Artomyces pyxidatus]|uniref:MFS general substrate transporter n=1 Tax=Artomyces pyxidatus TaxID=48021 RepID=A0ACB8SNZ6_9AGAM|nr:MFS general substrate transporter [Artomyces pyxidatus]
MRHAIQTETCSSSVVATAQPHIASTFNRLDLQSYIGTTYLLTSTVFLPFFGSVADVYGRHFALQSSLAFFTVGSAISTGAMSMPTMLVGRGVAGIGAAGMLTVVRVILSDSRSLNDNNWQNAILFFLYTIGYCTGPVIGGALSSISFRWIFAINLPAGVLAMLVSFLILRTRTKKEADPSLRGYTRIQRIAKLDWIGSFFFIGGGILILLALNWGSTAKWNDAKVIASFVVGGVLFALCLSWEYLLERKQKAETPSKSALFNAVPMIPLDMFRSFDVIAVSSASFVSGMIMLVMFYFVSIFFAIVNGYSATKAGTQLLFFAPGMGAGSLVALRIVHFTRQPRYPIILGGIVATVGIGIVSTAVSNNHSSLIKGSLFMSGFGIGLGVGPIATHARFSQTDERVAVVTALILFFRSFGGTVGLAQCGAVLNGKVTAYLKSLVESGAISASDASSLQLSGSNLGSIGSIQALPTSLQQYVKNGFQEGTRWAFISLIPWAGVAVIITLFLSKTRTTGTKREPEPSAVELVSDGEKKVSKEALAHVELRKV